MSDDPGRLRLVIVAPSLDGGDVGETYSAFRWVEALCAVAEVTVLASVRHHARPLAEQLPDARVVTWAEPRWLYTRFERFNAQAKPGLGHFVRRARAWIAAEQAAGRRFDILHQILPQAMRHRVVWAGLGIPYVIGPLGGGLDTPPGFAAEVGGGAGLGRLRELDRWRLRNDPWLRDGYRRAGLILGVAPYVGDRLREAGLGAVPFRPMLERGYGDAMPPPRMRDAEPGRMTLLHVGRAIRTKGLRDTIRALALLPDLPGVTLVSAGDGEDLAACRREAADLGVGARVRFLGRIPRAQVDEEYAAADVFCFPSFREPMGGVFFEAMAHGLPIVTAARGGPDFIVDDSCGLKVPATDPQQFARDIAAAIRRLAADPALRLSLGQGSLARLRSFGTWQDKADTMLGLYRDVLAGRLT
ncbi:glycosyltransferase [Frigidibacter oleivorans]|uniref:glycosyltransferase n=1 Tax=Frigidibacter oleivorans TaxID=2487129 RepID=UPI000F8D3520|nr:glycosyltransferase [Frigidibacter oleivorans]